MTIRHFLMACLYALTCLVLGPQMANAHSKSVSYSDWSIADDTEIIARVRIPARITTLLLRDAVDQTAFEAATDYVVQNLSLQEGSAECDRIGMPQTLVGTPDTLIFEVRFSCPGTGEIDTLSMQYDAFFEYSARHLHFVRAYLSDGNVFETVVTTSQRTASIFQEPSSDKEAHRPSFFVIGIEHILSGPDHIFFVLGLLLIAKSTRDLFMVVTGFTIGHSLSLAAATTGIVTTNSTLVESLIALTIWLLGVVALRKFYSAQSWMLVAASGLLVGLAWIGSSIAGAGLAPAFWIGAILLTLAYLSLSSPSHTEFSASSIILTASLGLAHGFGFAGGLQEAFSETDSLLLALVTFNIGVEVGQLLLIGVAIALAWIVRFIPLLEKSTRGLPAAIAFVITASGAFWFAERTML